MKFFIVLALLFGLLFAGAQKQLVKAEEVTEEATGEEEYEEEGTGEEEEGTGEEEYEEEGTGEEEEGTGEEEYEEEGTGEEEEVTGEEEEVTGEEEEVTGEEEEVTGEEEEVTGEEEEEVAGEGETTDGDTLLSFVQSSEDHKTLASLLADATAVSDMLTSEGPYTFFAPTDAAFDRLPAEVVDSLKEDSEALTQVLQYHLVAGSYTSEDLQTCQMLDTEATQKVLVRGDESGVSLDDLARVYSDMMDNEVSNGVVHAVDYVLMPASVTNCASKKSSECLLTFGCKPRMSGMCRPVKHVCPRAEGEEETDDSEYEEEVAGEGEVTEEEGYGEEEEGTEEEGTEEEGYGEEYEETGEEVEETGEEVEETGEEVEETGEEVEETGEEYEEETGEEVEETGEEVEETGEETEETVEEN